MTAMVEADELLLQLQDGMSAWSMDWFQGNEERRSAQAVERKISAGGQKCWGTNPTWDEQK